MSKKKIVNWKDNPTSLEIRKKIVDAGHKPLVDAIDKMLKRFQNSINKGTK